MALFMPTNVTPSTLGALGNGTVDATADMPVSWQVDGQNAMTAFRIRILANTTASTLLYDSGKKSDGCPFYGRDAGGNVVFFSYTIAASALASAGIRNGNSYKMLITQWWSSSDSITQQSASVFLCRSAPTLKINSFTTPVTTKEMTWTAAYTQAQGDSIVWVRWRLAAEGDTDTPLYDTGNVPTAMLRFHYDGLFAGQGYAVRCTVETSSGVTADTGWVSFRVSYSTTGYAGAVTACVKRRLSGVLVSWPGAYDIPGAAEGRYTVRGGELSLPVGSSITWDTVTGTPMEIQAPVSIVWRGTIKELPVTLFSLTGTSGEPLEIVLSETVAEVINNGETVGSVTEKFSVEDEITAVLTGGKFYIRRRYMQGLFPSAVLAPSKELFPKRKRTLLAAYSTDAKAAGMTVGKITLRGAQVCDYLWIESGDLADDVVTALLSMQGYEPEFGENTKFLADFASDLRGGNIAAQKQLTGWAVYRRTEGAVKLDHVADLAYSEQSVLDCAAASQGTYIYYVFGVDATSFATDALIGEPVKVCLWDWTLLSCREESGVFRVEELFRFSLNVESGTVNSGNRPSLLENFTRYPTVQMSPQLYQNGTLSGYLGEVSGEGEYQDTLEKRNALFALGLTQNTLFLKNRKGEVIKVFINGEITSKTQDATRQQALICSVPWAEVGDADGAQILIRQGDTLWPL